MRLVMSMLLIAISGIVIAAPVKSSIAAKQNSVNEVSEWVNPYVTDGLVAMWDGEWNAGGGVHDPNATVWKDLVGNRDATLTGDISWGANYVHRGATLATTIILPDVEIKPGFAIDYCMALINNGDGNLRDFATTSRLRMEIVRMTNGSLQRYYRNSKDGYVSRTGKTPFGLSTDT